MTNDDEVDTSKDDDDETEDELKFEMEEGKRDADVYTKEGREKLEEDDEIGVDESGFMKGEEESPKKKAKKKKKH